MNEGRIRIELRSSPSPRIPPLLKRHLLHLAPVLFAFLAPHVRWWGMAALFAAFIPFNFFLLQRLPYLKDIFRLGESYFNNGIRLYPVVVCAAYVLFRDHPHVATTAFVVMAVGDSFSGLAGGFLGRHNLPWTTSKTIEGLVGFFFPAWGASAFFLHYHAVPGLESWAACVQVALVASAAGALVESVYLRIDDNVTVIAASCAASWAAAAYFIRAESLGLGPYTLLAAVGLNAAVAALGYLLQAFTGGAAAAAFVIGGGVYASLGARGYGLLATYFVFLALLRPFDRERTPRLDVPAASALILPLAAAWAYFVLGGKVFGFGGEIFRCAYAGTLAALAGAAGGRVLPEITGKKGTAMAASFLSSLIIAVAGWGLLGEGFGLKCAASTLAGGSVASFIARSGVKRPWASVLPALAGALLAPAVYWLSVAEF